ncbi:MAG: hypothetical protein KF678_04610 [Phycisphaeraceae bacterium]|nr:hypothetical protein [Phycisphaeraceae bacterium]
MRSLIAALLLIPGTGALAQDKPTPATEQRRSYVSQLLPGTAPAARRPASQAPASIREVGAAGTWTHLRIDRNALAQAATAGAFVIPGVRLDGVALDLIVERFRITHPESRLVLGSGKGIDAPAAFDPETVVLLRGRVEQYPTSHLYLAVSPSMINGLIDLGPGYPRYGVSSRLAGRHLPEGEAVLFKAKASRDPNPAPFCQVHHPEHQDPPGGGGDAPFIKNLRQIQLAVETDHEFFQILGTEPAALEYVLHLYGAVSDIYMREINCRVDIVYTRIWPQPNEPFNASLNDFRSYWLANMGSVARDVAQMFSGRGDLPGGVAYLNSLCTNTAYGFCGNLVGFFADPESSSVFNYDPLVAAHELGHNCGTLHTHDYQLDTCADINTPAQRGTIMSYCNQTISGAMGVEDLTFHKVTRQAMMDYIVTRPNCVVFDCNQNGIRDSIDIQNLTSLDVNANGIPDECEDCNQNGILDTIDIGTISFDLNGNGIPDECEPDCNNNNIPDDRDILLGTSLDVHGNGIPDECEADLNGNNISDYTEIMANMALDIDRNRTLDSREDCDNDGIPDLAELDGAHNGWAASLSQPEVRSYHPISGVLMNTSVAGATAPVRDLVITPDRRILIAAANGVREYDVSGAFVRTLVPIGSGGLGVPSALFLADAATLLVADRTGNRILRYNLSTGAFINVFVAAGSGGLAAPMGITRGPSGDLFVTSETNNRVIRYNGTTGALIGTFVASSSGGLSAPKGLAFNPVTGNLLVASHGTDQVLEYNGATGAFLKVWSIVGVHFHGPWCIRIGRDGQVYVSASVDEMDTHFTRAKILIFEPRLGNFVRAYVQALDSQIVQTSGFDFMPGTGRDCNFNQVPDNCDIASGFSQDFNANGVPDECERTCYANCDLSTGTPLLTANDFQCFLNAFASGYAYANCDGSTGTPVLTANDFQCFLNRFAQGCP